MENELATKTRGAAFVSLDMVIQTYFRYSGFLRNPYFLFRANGEIVTEREGRL